MNKCKYCHYLAVGKLLNICKKEAVTLEYFKEKMFSDVNDKQFDCEYYEREVGSDDNL